MVEKKFGALMRLFKQERDIPAELAEIIPENFQTDTLYVACEAGIATSAIGAEMMQKALDEKGVNGVKAVHIVLNELPEDAKLVLTQTVRTFIAKQMAPQAVHLSVKNYLDNDFYEAVADRLKAVLAGQATATAEAHAPVGLTAEQVFLNQKAVDKAEALAQVGVKLVQCGFASVDYVPSLLAREHLATTYLGKGIAIPHGTPESESAILKTGVVFCQYPEGIRFNDQDEPATVLIGIAANDQEHLAFIRSLSRLFGDETKLQQLKNAKTKEEVLAILG